MIPNMRAITVILRQNRYLGEQPVVFVGPQLQPDEIVPKRDTGRINEMTRLIADSAISGGDLYGEEIGNVPRLAFLSYSTADTDQETPPERLAWKIYTEIMDRAARIVRGERQDWVVMGKGGIQFDAAVDEEVFENKVKPEGSTKFKPANVFVFPSEYSCETVLRLLENLPQAEDSSVFEEGLDFLRSPEARPKHPLLKRVWDRILLRPWKSRVIFTEKSEKVLQAMRCAANLGFVEPVLVAPPSEVDVQSLKGDGIIVQDPFQVSHGDLDSVVKPPWANPSLSAGNILLKQQPNMGMVVGVETKTSDILTSAYVRAYAHMKQMGLKQIYDFCPMFVGSPDPDKGKVICLVNTSSGPNPDAEQLAKTAIASAESFERLFETRAKVAFVTSAKRPPAKMKEALEKAQVMVQDSNLEFELTGPITADSAVKENCSVFVFPDLFTANIARKGIETILGGKALGPFLIGTQRPVAALSRNANTWDTLQATALVSFQISKPHVNKTPDNLDIFVTSRAGFSTLASKAAGQEICKLQKDPDKIVTIVFAAGDTMVDFLRTLASYSGIDWKRVQAFHLGDYKGVHPEAPHSLAYHLKENLVSRIPKPGIPAENVHYIDGTRPDLKRYMETLARLGGADIMVLTVGEDGHLGFNEWPQFSFFDSRAQEVRLSVEANKKYNPHIEENPYGYTMGMEDIFEGRHLFLLANTSRKAKIIQKGLDGPIDEAVPVSIVQAHRRVTVVLDADAASAYLKNIAESLDGAVEHHADDEIAKIAEELANVRFTREAAPFAKSKIVPALIKAAKISDLETSHTREAVTKALGRISTCLDENDEMLTGRIIRPLMKRACIGLDPSATAALAEIGRPGLGPLLDLLTGAQHPKAVLEVLVRIGNDAVDPLLDYLRELDNWDDRHALAQNLFELDKAGVPHASLFLSNLALIGFSFPITVEALGLYNRSPYKRTTLDVRIEEDLDAAGDAFAIEIIRWLQYWHKRLDLEHHPDRRIILQLCTGDSPFDGYRKIGGDKSLEELARKDPDQYARIMDDIREKHKRAGALLDTWNDPLTQQFLKDRGLDVKCRPDTSKLITFAVDGIFPQREDDYFSFANLLNNVCELWGIPQENRNFFRGDVHVSRQGDAWTEPETIPHDAYNKIRDSIEREGLKLAEYQAHCLLEQERQTKKTAQNCPDGFALNSPLGVRGDGHGGRRVIGYALIRQKNGRYERQEIEIEPLDENHVQFRFLEGMRNQALMMHDRLTSLGGAHITLLGVGHSYEGRGHIGFCEEGTPYNQTCFVRAVNDWDATFHVAGAHAKEIGGYAHAFVTVGERRMPRYGFTTFGPEELFYRRWKNIRKKTVETGQTPRRKNIEDEVTVIVIAPNNIKSSSVARAIEGDSDPTYPLSLTQGRRGTIILERASARDLRILKYPWDFQVFPRKYWAFRTARHYFIQLAKVLGGCKIAHVDNTIRSKRQQWKKEMEETSDPARTQIINNRRRNIGRLISHVAQTRKDRDPLQQAEDVARGISSRVVRPDDTTRVLESMGVRAGRKGEKRDKVFFANPHMDDEFLAMRNLIKGIADDFDAVAYYHAYGYTAVCTDYVLELLKIAGRLTAEEMGSLAFELEDKEGFLAREEELFEGLVEERAKFKEIPELEYEVFPHMRRREKELRAMIFILELNRRRDLEELEEPKRRSLMNKFTTPSPTRELRRFLVQVEASTPAGGSDIDIMRYAKTVVRFMEAGPALMSLGMEHENVNWPLAITYGALGRGEAFNKDDVEKIKGALLKERPKVIVFNGEGFPDFGGHSNTEIGVFTALFELIAERKISREEADGIVLLQWGGVWDVLRAESTQLSVAMSKEELADYADSFIYFYRSQAPYAPVLNASSARPQSFAHDVILASRQSAQEMSSLVDVSPPIDEILQKGGGVLHYRLRRLNSAEVDHEFRMKKELLEHSRTNVTLASSAAMMGVAAPSPRLRSINRTRRDTMRALGAISEREIPMFYA